MKEPILNVRDLHYVYGNGQVALDGVSVDIDEGEKIAVIGSNGAGKSTLLKILAGIMKPSSGEVMGEWLYLIHR